MPSRKRSFKITDTDSMSRRPTRQGKEKSDGPDGVGLMGHSGHGRHRPVILPPSREEGGRCSVKPASRGLLRSKKQEPRAFAQDTGLNSRLGMGRPVESQTKPGPVRSTQCSITFVVSTWITSLLY
ncbi:unnamed protein product [Arabidopsis lyrata]|nr:unnamed protein product [Arabidopsis lyrata]